MRRCKLFLVPFLLLITAVHAGNPEIVREQIRIDLREQATNQVVSQQQEEDVIIIWVHGTNSFQWFKKIFFKKFFYTCPGMHNISKFPANVHLSKIAVALSKADPVHFPLKNFYLFCWSGKLSVKARKKAGKDFTKAMKKLFNDYCASHNGRKPKIIVYTHSHGANAILSMVKDKDMPAIYRLIMLAPPVQELTAANCHNTELFEEVYSLYSTNDLMQVLDPEIITTGKGSWHSKRIFPHQENVLQAQIEMDGRDPRHIHFIQLPFISCLPRIIEKMHSWRENGGNQEEKRHILEITTVS